MNMHTALKHRSDSSSVFLLILVIPLSGKKWRGSGDFRAGRICIPYKRGIERWLFWATIGLSAIFIHSSNGKYRDKARINRLWTPLFTWHSILVFVMRMLQNERCYLRNNTDARIVDICHTIKPPKYKSGSICFAYCLPFLSREDDSYCGGWSRVGSQRRTILLRTPFADFLLRTMEYSGHIIQEVAN